MSKKKKLKRSFFLQITSILILTLIRANAEAPPGYVKPAEAPEKVSRRFKKKTELATHTK
jgi:hypothetical protein